ncbi:MAG: pitrilysin family protein [Turneriella sp.]
MNWFQSQPKPGVERYQLGNGLTVLLENIPHRTSATVGLWLPVGSRFERHNEAGYSHFVEHMLFKGTKKRHYTEISRAVDRLGGHLNASTSKEMTDYYISLSGRHIPVALDVLADMFYDSLFSKSEFESEKKVIIEELKMGEDQPDDFLFDLFYSHQIGDNSLGRPVAGHASGISKSTRDGLYAYYTSHYGPSGAVLSLAGALYNSATEKNALMRNITGCFDRNDHDLKGSPAFRSAEFASPEFQAARPVKQSNLKHQSKKLEQVNFVVSLPGLKADLDQPADLAVLTHYLGGTMSSRLFIELREKKGLCYSVSTFHSQFLHEGVWGIFCASSPDKFGVAVETALDEINALASGIDAGELEESKSGLKGSIELSMESAYRRASYNARMHLYYGVVRDWREYLSAVDRVTASSFLSTLRHLWRGTAPGITSLGPKLSAVTHKKLTRLVKQQLLN